MAALLAIVVGLLLYGTLSPFHFVWHPGNPFAHLLHTWPTHLDRGTLRDVLLNIVIFVPFGVAACLTYADHWSRRTAFGMAVIHGVVFSLGIEILQYYDVTRQSSIADVACNAGGALVGATLALVFERHIEAVISAAGRRGAPAALTLGLVWIGCQVYPLIPYITIPTIGAGVRHLMASRVSWVSVIAGAGAWFTFGFALRTVWGKISWVWLALTMLVLPMQLVIVDRTLSVSDLLAAGLALVLWIVIKDPMRPGAALVLMTATVVLHELAPFRFPGPARPFSWIPFAASLGSDATNAVVVILRKTFEYGALVWLFTVGRLSYRVSGAVVSVGLLACELIQTRMPGRSPEITDAVLALIMALVLGLLS